MASIDHTARARLLAQNKPNTKTSSSIGNRPEVSGAGQERRQTYVSRRAGCALAVAVLEGMLRTHEQFEQDHPNGKRVGLLPLNPVQLIGFENAIDLLCEYADALKPEGGR